MAFLQTRDGTRLFVNDWGQGRPVVLVHGWPLDSDMWEYQATALASAGRRVIAYDRRGFGRSDQPWNGYDYDTLADDLAAVLEATNAEDAVLVGFSMGGGEVARYASRHAGKRVGRNVFVSAVTPFLLKTANNPEGVEKRVFDEMAAGVEADRPAFLAKFGKQFYGDSLLKPTVSKEVLEWTAAVALRGSARATRACIRAFSETDFRNDLDAVRAPTLFIHGTSDATVPIDVSARKAVTLVRGAELREYEGAPHGLYATEKDRLARDLLAFSH